MSSSTIALLLVTQKKHLPSSSTRPAAEKQHTRPVLFGHNIGQKTLHKPVHHRTAARHAQQQGIRPVASNSPVAKQTSAVQSQHGAQHYCMQSQPA
jgi:hypothetical protein